MKKLFFLQVFLFVYYAAPSQDTSRHLYADLSLLETKLDISSSAYILLDSLRLYDSDKVAKQSFIPLVDFPYRKKIPGRFVNKTTYLKFSVINTDSSKKEFYFFPGMLYSHIQVHRITEKTLEKIKNPLRKEGFIYLELDPGKKAEYLIELHFTKVYDNYVEAILVHKDFLTIFNQEINPLLIDKRVTGYILSGVLLMMIVFTLVNYFINRKIEFLYNCLYSLSMFLLILFTTYLAKNPGAFKAFFISYLDLFLLVAGTIAYLVFTRKFLETETNYPILDKFLRIEEWVLAILMTLYSFIHFGSNNFLLQAKIENILKLIILSAGIVYIVMAFVKKNRLMNYLAIGSSIQIFFSIISFILIFIKADTTYLFNAPFFYFQIGVVFSVVFFLLGLTYKNRVEIITKIKEQEALKLIAEKQSFQAELDIIKAQQEERNRISADMHDDLGSGMTSIRLYSEIARAKIGENDIPEIDKISASASELINKMNAIIWSMSSHNDSLGNMVAYIRSYVVDYFEDIPIDTKIDLPEKLPNIQVPGIVRRNIFLVVKEALHNVVKHSGATEVHISMQKHPEGFSLIIQDNGTGITSSKTREFGNGLRNMKKRMDDVEIDFKIENYNGTRVTLYRKTR